MPNDGPYSRVYHSIREDDKFADVYADDRRLATWLRLLIAAEQAFPASAPIPQGTRKASFDALVDAGLIERRPFEHFRVHGLDAEREARSQAGRDAVAKRKDRQINGAPTPVLPPYKPPTTTLPLERERVQEREREKGGYVAPAPAHEGELPPLTVAIDFLEERSGRPWNSRPGSKVWDTLDADVRDFGAEAVIAEMRKVDAAHPDHAQLVFGATRSLHVIATPAPPPPPSPERIREVLAERKRQRKENGDA